MFGTKKGSVDEVFNQYYKLDMAVNPNHNASECFPSLAQKIHENVTQTLDEIKIFSKVHKGGVYNVSNFPYLVKKHSTAEILNFCSKILMKFWEKRRGGVPEWE